MRFLVGSIAHIERAYSWYRSVDYFEPNVFELDHHLRVMELELQHAPFQTHVVGQVLGELGSKSIVDVEHELISASDDVHFIPLPAADV